MGRSSPTHRSQGNNMGDARTHPWRHYLYPRMMYWRLTDRRVGSTRKIIVPGYALINRAGEFGEVVSCCLKVNVLADHPASLDCPVQARPLADKTTSAARLRIGTAIYLYPGTFIPMIMSLCPVQTPTASLRRLIMPLPPRSGCAALTFAVRWGSSSKRYSSIQ